MINLKQSLFALIALLKVIFVSAESSGRIVGGFAISIEVSPYQVSLQYIEPGRRKTVHFCGGSIVSEKFIVTARHCTENLIPSDLIVLVGTSFYNRGGRKMNAKRIINHQNYSRRNQDYDIALIELTHSLVFSSSVQAIALPNVNEDIADGTYCIVTGFGEKRRFTFFQRTELRAVEVPIVNQIKCFNSYKMYGEITPRMLCAGFGLGGKDACQGDSGGPLACYTAYGILKLFGIVSWGYDCAVPQFPGVYTRVHKFSGWIQDKMGL